MIKIILASTSPFRQVLLEKLRIPFTCVAPNVDECVHPGEQPDELVLRLAKEKANAIPADNDTFIIGADQVATCDNQILGKPLTRDKAIAQLRSFSGKKVIFYTGLCLRKNDTHHTKVEQFCVSFRHLSDEEITAYIDLDLPLHCAGSFKSEGLGILLFDALEGRDPNALIGLPLIALNELFLQYGTNLLTCAK